MNPIHTTVDNSTAGRVAQQPPVLFQLGFYAVCMKLRDCSDWHKASNRPLLLVTTVSTTQEVKFITLYE